MATLSKKYPYPIFKLLVLMAFGGSIYRATTIIYQDCGKGKSPRRFPPQILVCRMSIFWFDFIGGGLVFNQASLEHETIFAGSTPFWKKWQPFKVNYFVDCHSCLSRKGLLLTF